MAIGILPDRLPMRPVASAFYHRTQPTTLPEGLLLSTITYLYDVSHRVLFHCFPLGKTQNDKFFLDKSTFDFWDIN